MDPLPGASGPFVTQVPGDSLGPGFLPDSLRVARPAPPTGWPWVALAVAAGVLVSWLLFSRRSS